MPAMAAFRHDAYGTAAGWIRYLLMAATRARSSKEGSFRYPPISLALAANVATNEGYRGQSLRLGYPVARIMVSERDSTPVLRRSMRVMARAIST